MRAGAAADAEDTRGGPAAAADAFSLVRGDPLDRFFRALHLGGPGFARARLRATLLAAACWLPLALLAALEGVAFAPGHASFARDVSTHVRCLLGIPLLILAERPIDAAFADGVHRLWHHRLVAPDQAEQLARILARVRRLQRSLAPTAVLLLVAALRSFAEAKSFVAGSVPSWIAPHAGAHALSLAGWWALSVSLPVWGFLLILWVWRWALWCYLLFRVSRLRLQLLGAHPDGAGALGFLEEPATAFSSVVLAGAAAVSGTWIHRVAFEGADVRSFLVPLVGMILGAFAVVLGPMAVFVSKLYWLRTDESERYDRLAQRYQRAFDCAWLPPAAPAGEVLLREMDAQTLADLRTVAASVHEIRIVPFGKKAPARLLLATLAPMVPLVLTVVPTREILVKLVDALL